MNYPAKSGYRSPAIAAGYDEQRFTRLWGRMVGAREIQIMLSALDEIGAGANALVLDAPAGTCRLTMAAAKAGRRVVSCDISDAMLTAGFTKRGVAKLQGSLGAVVGDVESLPIRDRSVDAVACLRLMGHLPPEQKKTVIAEILRVSRLGAAIMFARRTRFLSGKRWLLGRLGLRFRSEVWFDQTDVAIAALIADAGGLVVRRVDLFGPLAESRLYVIRHKP